MTNFSPSLFMVFDVESIGLHGEGFAVGYVVLNKEGKIYEEKVYACSADKCSGSQKSHNWVKENVPSLKITHNDSTSMRNDFWESLQKWKSLGAILVADCCWPVEARFLNACVDDDLEIREYQGPYPLHDLASILLAYGKDPLGSNVRLEDELPIHNPLADAKQSARLLLEAIKECTK